MEGEVYQPALDGVDDGLSHLYVVVLTIGGDRECLVVPAYSCDGHKVNEWIAYCRSLGQPDGQIFVQLDNGVAIDFAGPFPPKEAYWCAGRVPPSRTTVGPAAQASRTNDGRGPAAGGRLAAGVHAGPPADVGQERAAQPAGRVSPACCRGRGDRERLAVGYKGHPHEHQVRDHHPRRGGRRAAAAAGRPHAAGGGAHAEPGLGSPPTAGSARPAPCPTGSRAGPTWPPCRCWGTTRRSTTRAGPRWRRPPAASRCRPPTGSSA